MMVQINREFNGNISSAEAHLDDGSSLSSQLPFKKGDNFKLTVSYTYDPTKYLPAQEHVMPADINFEFKFSVPGLTVYNDATGSCILERSILLTADFNFTDMCPHYTPLPGKSWFNVDEFYASFKVASPSSIGLNLTAGSSGGAVVADITSFTFKMVSLPLPPHLKIVPVIE